MEPFIIIFLFFLLWGLYRYISKLNVFKFKVFKLFKICYNCLQSPAQLLFSPRSTDHCWWKLQGMRFTLLYLLALTTITLLYVTHPSGSWTCVLQRSHGLESLSLLLQQHFPICDPRASYAGVCYHTPDSSELLWLSWLWRRALLNGIDGGMRDFKNNTCMCIYMRVILREPFTPLCSLSSFFCWCVWF